jgi:hypothetical protein
VSIVSNSGVLCVQAERAGKLSNNEVCMEANSTFDDIIRNAFVVEFFFAPARAIPRAILQSLEEEEGEREGGRNRWLRDEISDSRVDDADADADADDKGLLEAGLTYMQGRKPATTAVTFFRQDVTP